jgi:hypothetical protein
MATKSEDTNLRPLMLQEVDRDMTCFHDKDRDLPIPCMVCEESFNGTDGEQVRQEYLRHLLASHNIVIHNASHVVSYKCYAHYWKVRFASVKSISSLLPVIETHPDTPNDKSTRFYVLDDVQQEDKDIRMFMQQTRLQVLLKIQQSEREDNNFKRKCLFCNDVFVGNRSILFKHMFDSHHFNIGQPDNIVFINDLLDLLQSKIDKLQCIYCERYFKNSTAFRDHMRKKHHKKINSKNQLYDRFYMINYLVSKVHFTVLGDFHWNETIPKGANLFTLQT